jgi:tRNA (guanine10-N2)-methyltransferase
MVRLLCWFVHKHLEFREPELRALCEMHGVPLQLAPPVELEPEPEPDAGAPPQSRGTATALPPDSVLRLADFPDEDTAARIGSRAVLLRSVLEIWGCGTTYEECVAAAVAYPAAKKEPYLDSTFKVRVDAFGKHISQKEQLERVNRFLPVGLRGKVRLKHPEQVFWIVEDYGGPSSTRDTPQQIYFCRQVCESGRKAVDTYDLKKRRYLGPTSMDAELALIAANMAHARAGTLMLDPFAGTGSMMVAAAHFGAETWGGEIHPPMLRGKRKGLNVRSNYTQYKLQMPQLFVADFSHSPWVAGRGMFDSIICDPPYGIREGSRQINVRAQTTIDDDTAAAPPPTRDDGGTVASGGKRERLAVVDALQNLLDFAAGSLVVGGRLVYWLPTTMDYLPEDCPTHPLLEMVANCESALLICLPLATSC